MNLIPILKELGIIKYSEIPFTLKSGEKSNIYFNLRELVAYPDILEKVADAIYQKIKHISFDLICGIPYTGIPIVSIISQKYKIPMIVCKKERKTYGLGGIIDGKFNVGDRVVLIDDLITDGQSKLEFIEILENEGLNVNAIGVYLDRTLQNTKLSKKYKIFSVVSIANFDLKTSDSNVNYMKKIKMECNNNMITSKLLYVMQTKKTNLVLSADMNNANTLLDMVNKVGEYICCVKLHIDIIEVENYNGFVKDIVFLSKKHNFLIIVDRKFCDIGNTVAHQLHRGAFHISEFADLVTVHTVMGEGTIEGLISEGKCPGLLLLAQASSKNNLITEDYTKKTAVLAEKYHQNVVGFICQEGIVKNSNFLHFTPGVNISTTGDSLGQQYNSPEAVIGRGSDIIIVGRGIYGAADPVVAAKQYRDEGWKAYNARTN